MGGDPAPLILTLALDPAATAQFDALRRAHFPPERNLVPAHLTLFHHLPGEEEGAVRARLAALAARHDPIPLPVTGVRLLGRGVAFTLEAPALAVLRRDLAAAWADWLRPQDRQPFRPHVTVQNKVTPEAARALHRRLADAFAPFTARGEGFLLWRYRGGPWDAVARLPFAAAVPPQ